MKKQPYILENDINEDVRYEELKKSQKNTEALIALQSQSVSEILKYIYIGLAVISLIFLANCPY